MGGFPGRLDFHVVHQLLAAGQPDVGGDNADVYKRQDMFFAINSPELLEAYLPGSPGQM